MGLVFPNFLGNGKYRCFGGIAIEVWSAQCRLWPQLQKSVRPKPDQQPDRFTALLLFFVVFGPMLNVSVEYNGGSCFLFTETVTLC